MCIRDRVKGMTCVEMELGEPDASGRRRPIVKEGSEFELDVDTVSYTHLDVYKRQVCHTVEKQVVSHDAICGAYYFKNKQLYASACAEYRCV